MNRCERCIELDRTVAKTLREYTTLLKRASDALVGGEIDWIKQQRKSIERAMERYSAAKAAFEEHVKTRHRAAQS
jgi:hypothetical protein